MTQGYIKYRSEYKHQLSAAYNVTIPIQQPKVIETEFINLDPTGKLFVKKGYAWDGPSGPVPDTRENMRASLVHDALYQLMRNNELSKRTWRKTADQIFKEICKDDGISVYWASIWYKGLRKFGDPLLVRKTRKRSIGRLSS